MGFLPYVFVASASSEDSLYVEQLKSWPEKGTTYFCYQGILYWYKFDDGTYFFDLNQETHKFIAKVIAIVNICVVFAVMLAVYTYIAVIVISLGRRKKALNSKFRYVYLW